MAKFDVFGTTMIAIQHQGQWQLTIDSGLGLRRPVKDVVIPLSLDENELAQYLGDIYHEWAIDRHPHILKLSKLSAA